MVDVWDGNKLKTSVFLYEKARRISRSFVGGWMLFRNILCTDFVQNSLWRSMSIKSSSEIKKMLPDYLVALEYLVFIRFEHIGEKQ